MKKVIRFNGIELITKSEAKCFLGFVNLNAVDHYIRKGRLEEYQIIGLDRKLFSLEQVKSLKTGKREVNE